MRRFLATLTVLSASALAACGGDDAKSKDLTVGVLLPMTGGQATYGEESWNGMKIAEAEIRRADPKFVFTLELADEQSSKEQSGPQTKKLIENHGAQIVVGSVASSNTMGAAVVCKEAGIPLLTPASTNDGLTEDAAKYGTNLFRVCFKDSFQGTMLARFAWNTLKAKKAVSLVDKASAYSVGLEEQFRKEFVKLGGTVSGENFNAQDKDFTTLVEKVGGQKPEVILFSGYYEQAGAMLRISKDAWRGIPVIGGDGLDSEKLMKLAGEPTSKVYFTSHFVASDTDPLVQAFVTKYRDRFGGKVPGAMAALGYDALYAVFEAGKRARAAHASDPWTPAHVAEGLRGLEFTGVTGKIRIGADRTPRKEIVIVEALGSGFQFVTKIPPE
jgi:branched-chain amino acid transport system substrate-binding protein